MRISSGERSQVTRPTAQRMLDKLTGTAHLLMDRPDGMAHFEELRLYLEISIARHVAETATVADLAALGSALAVNERCINRTRAFATTDVAFHRVLTQVQGNPIFLAVHEALVAWLISQRIHTRNTRVENRRSFAGHAAVFDAIRRGDPDGAGAAMRAHLENAKRKFRWPAA